MNRAARPAAIPLPESNGTFWSRFVSLFAHNYSGNLLLVITIVIGFFHGWLKLRFRSGITTFAFDIPLVMALAVTLAQIPKMESWFPQGRVGTWLKFFTGTALIYLLLPLGMPFLIGLASFRAWCFIPLTFLLGYHLVRSVRQVEVYFWLIILLGAITALYGMRQSPEEIRLKMAEDAEFAARFFNTFYGNSKGESRLRVFSTFVSAAAFGGTMAYAIMFAVSRFSVAGNSWKERLLLLSLAVPMAYGVVLSGSRTSMVMMATGLIFTAWYRRNVLQYIFAPALAAAAFKFGENSTGGDSLDRFGTLLDPQQFIGRLYIVISPTIESLTDHPLGGGLGRSGHGLPASLASKLQGVELRMVDGDMGRLAVDMGLVGIFVFVGLLTAAVMDAFRNMKGLRDTPLTVVGVPAGAMFMIAVVTVPTGSPFLSIPNGALLWFFLGALERLTLEYRKLEARAPEMARSDAMFVSFIQPRKTKMLFAEEKPGPSAPAAPRFRIAALAQPKKRFLFTRSATERTPAPAKKIPARRQLPRLD